MVNKDAPRIDNKRGFEAFVDVLFIENFA